MKYKASEAEVGRSMEMAVSVLMQMGSGSAVAADLAAAARAATYIVATEGQATAAQFRALGTLAAEAETSSAGASESLLKNALACIGQRCNPANYRIQLRGLGSNFGNAELEYVGAETAEAGGEAVHAPSSTAVGGEAVHAKPSASTGQSGIAAAEAAATPVRGRGIPLDSPEAAKLPRPSAGEQAWDDYLRAQGDYVERNPLEHQSGAGRQFDRYINGEPTEYKTLDPGANSNRIKNVVNDSIRREGQAPNIYLDARGTGMTQEEAERGIRRALGISRGKVKVIRIVGDNFDVRN